MALPLKYNIQNVLVRWRSTLATVLGIGLVVGVYVLMQAMAAGIEKSSANTGSPDNLMVTRKGSTSESSSIVSREQLRSLLYSPEIARNAAGEPLVSADVLILLNQPRRDGGGEANVLMRGVSPRGREMRPRSRTDLGTSTSKRNRRDATVGRINVIGWDSFPFSLRDAAGVTYWTSSRSTLAIVDADIFLNTQETWTLRDVDAVMTHEFGHLIGLDHSNVKTAIMIADPYNSFEYQRTLRDDDVAGCTKLYGASPNVLTNRTLNWAETYHASALKGGPVVTLGDADGFVYRYYPQSNSTAGVKNGTAYFMGPDRIMQNMGPLSGFTPQVLAAGF